MATNNNNTATPNNGVAVNTIEMLWFFEEKISEATYDSAISRATFPYVKTKNNQIQYFFFKRNRDYDIEY